MVLYAPLSADDLIYSYDGTVLPHDPSGGWEIFDPCEGGCSESLGSGHVRYVRTWVAAASQTNVFRLKATWTPTAGNSDPLRS